eukprot:scaffold3064_cov231-Pinguiococcus_pyrenoidosus.AAC.2
MNRSRYAAVQCSAQRTGLYHVPTWQHAAASDFRADSSPKRSSAVPARCCSRSQATRCEQSGSWVPARREGPAGVQRGAGLRELAAAESRPCGAGEAPLGVVLGSRRLPEQSRQGARSGRAG